VSEPSDVKGPDDPRDVRDSRKPSDARDVRDPRRKDDPRDPSASEVTEARRERDARIITQRVQDALVLGTVILIIVVLALVVGFVVNATGRISTITQDQLLVTHRQTATVQQQNDAQLCNQHDIVLAVRRLGLGFSKSLGLPVKPYKEIRPPSTEGLNCAST
jgi:uncharacterized protein HemX